MLLGTLSSLRLDQLLFYALLSNKLLVWHLRLELFSWKLPVVIACMCATFSLFGYLEIKFDVFFDKNQFTQKLCFRHFWFPIVNYSYNMSYQFIGAKYKWSNYWWNRSNKLQLFYWYLHKAIAETAYFGKIFKSLLLKSWRPHGIPISITITATLMKNVRPTMLLCFSCKHFFLFILSQLGIVWA